MLTPEQQELCLIYGAQSRQYSPGSDWARNEPRLRAGWLRVRGDWTIPWEAAAVHVRQGWDSGVPGRVTGNIPAITAG